MDFGETDASGSGAYCLDFTPHSGYSPNGVNFEVSDTDPGLNHAQAVALPPVLDNSGEMYLVMIFDPPTQSMLIYTNGVLMGRNNNATIPMSAIVNAHSYLGKSSYSGDPDGVAALDEFRIYNGAMPTWQLAVDYADGPDTVPETVPILSITHSGDNITLTWPGTAPDYSLQASAKMGSSALWTALPGSPTPIFTNNNFQITLPVANHSMFYRLSK